MRSIDKGRNTEIEQDNETPAEQEKISEERVEGESRQLQEGDVEKRDNGIAHQSEFLRNHRQLRH